MQPLVFLALFLVAPLATAQKNTILVTRNILSQAGAKYTSQHDIVNMVVPANRDSFWDSSDDKYWTYALLGLDAIFFVEASNNNGVRNYHGLYLYKSQEVTKLLDNGRDATAFATSSKAYLGATDGIYVYDYNNATIHKYGTLTDNITQIQANHKTGVLYFVTDDHQVFSVADEGRTKKKVNINNVKEIAIDFDNNMYYSDIYNNVYVVNQAGSKKIEGIPVGEIKLVNPSFRQMGVFAVVDNAIYLLNANGSARKINVTLQLRPTAFGPHSSTYFYFALNRKIYSFEAERVHLSHIADMDEYYQVIHYRGTNVLLRALSIVQ